MEQIMAMLKVMQEKAEANQPNNKAITSCIETDIPCRIPGKMEEFQFSVLTE
jgi:hypothetical protein